MLLEVTELTKAFRDTMAVDHISCTLGNGVYGLLGVNGAGKTTFMRMLCTLLLPDSGAIRWEGSDIFSMGGAYRKLLGYLPQDFGYYPDLPYRITSCISLPSRGLRPAYAKKHAEQLLQQVGLWDIRKQKMKKLSGGMKRRVAILRAISAEYDVLLADEPFQGLDEATRCLTMEYFKAQTAGKTVLLVTHEEREAAFFGGELYCYSKQPKAKVIFLCLLLLIEGKQTASQSAETSGRRARPGGGEGDLIHAETTIESLVTSPQSRHSHDSGSCSKSSFSLHINK